jgi:DNA replication and repair protein RecF
MSLQLDRLARCISATTARWTWIWGPEVNCFVGPNGTGKTNLLDAVHYLSLARATSTRWTHNILHGEELFMVQGTMHTEAGEDAHTL